ncbi:NADH dehydrogenase [ubiquinone] iron-sulfur protein 6, mitochondrial-like [Sinocyclocheilus grahami]|uniref:NADH dehydrogenase [ubiquinone] iron-sulfur protein 6, mitochondrial-like n=1 Tax=Sinocyclocheilus grahami TaxID=75366 RepID=UPI0007AD34B1|nr:PREDICTED: NADH dehydrogenase [ubiquinone] iron-sulfur protein 6, mitochondrial-like [Sinocyclocheilus grahami]
MKDAAASVSVSVDWIIPFTAYLLQVYNQNDVRRARFIGRQKEVNENFAISLAAEEPVTYLESRVVSCDGGGGAIGHPRVYINQDKETKSGTCGYCGLQFKQKHHH